MTKIDQEVKKLKEVIDELEWYIDDFSTFLPLAVCTLNPLGVVVNINKAFEILTGKEDLEVVRELAEGLFKEKGEFKKILEKAKSKKAVQQKELVLISKDKKEIIVSVSVSLREDKGGLFEGYFVALTDITELKKLQTNLESQVAEKTKELQEKLRALEKFTQLTVGRELKMVELKDKIKEIEKNK